MIDAYVILDYMWRRVTMMTVVIYTVGLLMRKHFSGNASEFLRNLEKMFA